MYLGNIVGLIIVLTCVPLFAAILRIPFSIIAPIILVLCAIGAYTVHNSTFDVVMMLVFGVVGYVLKKCNYPLAPLVLAIVLGDKAEEAFRQSLLASQGSLGVFFSNGLVGIDHGARPDRAVLAADPERAGRRLRPAAAPDLRRIAEASATVHAMREVRTVALDVLEYCIPAMSNDRPYVLPRPASRRQRRSAARRRCRRGVAVEPIDTPVSFKNKAYAALKDVIVSMDIYRSRDDIRLDERQLAQDFGISRTPVREAMAQLEREGFVRSVPRRGIYVVRKTKREVIEMITAWAALESMAARLITESASDEEIAVAAHACSRRSRTASCARNSTNIPRSTSSSTRPSSA